MLPVAGGATPLRLTFAEPFTPPDGSAWTGTVHIVDIRNHTPTTRPSLGATTRLGNNSPLDAIESWGVFVGTTARRGFPIAIGSRGHP